jgi:8-oxo-dGTP diphosphatase
MTLTHAPVPAHLLTVVVLFHENRLLLLKRAPWKQFAPDRWTGIGGKVEPHELADVSASASRELFEETDLGRDEVSRLVLRRCLTFHRESDGLTCLLYFTGTTKTDRVPTCNEGTLKWVAPDDLSRLETIDNSGSVFERLVRDVACNRSGVKCGTATYTDDGRMLRIGFEDDEESAP